ncbi:MAG: hypothetical protein R3E58_17530 [Phycisphaerae bacterium]
MRSEPVQRSDDLPNNDDGVSGSVYGLPDRSNILPTTTNGMSEGRDQLPAGSDFV